MVPFSEGKLQGFQVAKPPQVLLSLGSDSGRGFGILQPQIVGWHYG